MRPEASHRYDSGAAGADAPTARRGRPSAGRVHPGAAVRAAVTIRATKTGARAKPGVPTPGADRGGRAGMSFGTGPAPLDPRPSPVTPPTPLAPLTALAPAAVVRALAEMGSVSGAFASSPCAFVPLGPEADGLLGGLGPGGAGGWVLVAVRASAEADHRAHLRERCRTAVQRFVLTLACDDVESAWVADGLPDAEAFRRAGVDLGGREPAGLVWCAGG